MLWKKHNYKADIKLIKNCNIIEYDMSEAGWNLIQWQKLLSQKTIDELKTLSKNERTIEIGKLMNKEKNLSKELMECFIEARKMFFEYNDLKDYEVLSIKKDAIFTLKTCYNGEINEYINFRNKHNYIGYVNLMDREFYWNGRTNEFTIKGFPKETLINQKDYLFKNLTTIFKKLLSNTDSYIEDLAYLKYDFTAFNLDIPYYKDILFNKYLVNTYGDILLEIDEIDKESLQYCNSSNNLNFILNMLSVLI